MNHRIGVLCAALLLPSSLAAQTYTSPWQDVVNGQITSMSTLGGLETMRQSFELANDAASRAAPNSTASADTTRSALAFEPSTSVSRRVQAKLLEPIRAESPQAAESLQKIFEAGELERAFDQLLSQFGYSSHNLADVATAYLIMSWEIVNDADASEQTDGIAAVHRRLLAAFAQNLQVLRFSDAAKQEAAETMTLSIMLALAASREYRERGESEPLDRLRAGLRAGVQKSFGIDLGAARLTRDGFRTA